MHLPLADLTLDRALLHLTLTFAFVLSHLSPVLFPLLFPILSLFLLILPSSFLVLSPLSSPLLSLPLCVAILLCIVESVVVLLSFASVTSGHPRGRLGIS